MCIQVLLHLKGGLAVATNVAAIDLECMGTCDMVVELIEAGEAPLTANRTRDYLTTLVSLNMGLERGNIADVGVAGKATELRL